MLARILLGLGGTPFTPTAIRYAVELAQIHEAELLGTTVIDRRRLGALVKSSTATHDAVRELKRIDDVEKQQEQVLADFESACKAAGINYAVARESGDPFETMISRARYHDLMIFGLRSLFDCDLVRTDASEVLTKLVSRGARPILAVSQEYRPIHRVLLAYSGSMESAQAIKRFMHMKLWPDLTLKIITFEQPIEIAQELLDDMADYCRAHGYVAEVECVAGPPQQLLLEHATAWQADLTVLGGSSKHYWLRKLFGETAMHVIRHAEIPLFLSQ